MNADGSLDGAIVCNSGPQPVGGVYTVSIPPTTIPVGSRLSVTIFESAAVASTSREVYGGRGLMTNYGDAGHADNGDGEIKNRAVGDLIRI